MPCSTIFGFKVTGQYKEHRMSGTYDVYRGLICARIDGEWRRCKLFAGYCTVADWWKPNQHMGICRVTDLAHDDCLDLLNDISWHPGIMIGQEACP